MRRPNGRLVSAPALVLQLRRRLASPSRVAWRRTSSSGSVSAASRALGALANRLRVRSIHRATTCPQLVDRRRPERCGIAALYSGPCDATSAPARPAKRRCGRAGFFPSWGNDGRWRRRSGPAPTRPSPSGTLQGGGPGIRPRCPRRRVLQGWSAAARGSGRRPAARRRHALMGHEQVEPLSGCDPGHRWHWKPRARPSSRP
jgi:hypothetical protein